MKIVILADSLALPRPAGEGDVPYEVTYPYLLDRRLRARLGGSAPQIIERGMRLRTIEDVLGDWLEMVELRRADVVVVHVGIVDCAPRVFLRRERALVERLRPARLRVRLLNLVHRHRRRIVQLRRRTYVTPERFRSTVEKVVKKAKDAKLRALIFVNIIAPTDELERRSPGFKQNVEAYNLVLREQIKNERVSLIDLDGLVWQVGAGELTVDSIHLNESGHRLLAGELEKCIMPLCEGDAAQSVSGV